MNVEERIFQIIGIIIGFCLSLAILIPITIQDMTIKNKIFYYPGEMGREKKTKQFLKFLRRADSNKNGDEK